MVVNAYVVVTPALDTAKRLGAHNSIRAVAKKIVSLWSAIYACLIRFAPSACALVTYAGQC